MSALNLRLNDALKSEAVAYARSIGVSLNALVAVAVRGYLDARIVPSEPFAPPLPLPRQRGSAGGAPAAPSPQSRPKVDALTVAKVGRNDPCPCGNGKKFKQCHGGAT